MPDPGACTYRSRLRSVGHAADERSDAQPRKRRGDRDQGKEHRGDGHVRKTGRHRRPQALRDVDERVDEGEDLQPRDRVELLPRVVDTAQEGDRDEPSSLLSRRLRKEEAACMSPRRAKEGMALALANAVYFHADWAHPFEKAKTSPGDFHKAAGKATVDFMHQLAGAVGLPRPTRKSRHFARKSRCCRAGALPWGHCEAFSPEHDPDSGEAGAERRAARRAAAAAR